MRRDRVLRLYLRERFIVALKAGDTFDGLLDEHDESTIELLDAHLVEKDGTLTAVNGRLYVPRSEIAYMQRPDAR